MKAIFKIYDAFILGFLLFLVGSVKRSERADLRVRKSNAIPIALLQHVPLARAPVAEAYASYTASCIHILACFIILYSLYLFSLYYSILYFS